MFPAGLNFAPGRAALGADEGVYSTKTLSQDGFSRIKWVHRVMTKILFLIVLFGLGTGWLRAAEASPDPAALRGKVLCGYQAWFRCPGDAANMGWVHWSRDSRRIAPETLSFEMWPDVHELPASGRFPAPGFTDAEGKPAELYSADNAEVVQRHFEWMRDAGIDGIWLQHFVVDLAGGPAERRYESRRRVIEHVRQAAGKTGRVWAMDYDMSGMRGEKLFEVLTRDWKKLVDDGVIADPRYVCEGGKPVVEIWGLYHKETGNFLPTEIANRLLDFFKGPGPYAAYVVGGGDWDWRRNKDADWQQVLTRLDAYSPWNVGNTSKDKAGVVHAATSYWAEDKKTCEERGQLWLPVVYPGFSWDNLQRKAPGTTGIPRRGGQFLWEQFGKLREMGVDSVKVAMFDEVDEGTAIFKVTNQAPTQAHFVTFEGLPSDWYLRLTGEATRLLRERKTFPAEILLKP